MMVYVGDVCDVDPVGAVGCHVQHDKGLYSAPFEPVSIFVCEA